MPDPHAVMPDTSSDQIELSIVVPVYCCRDCLVELHDRVSNIVSVMGVTYEIVLVDDRSPDSAWPLMRGLAEGHDCVHAVRLSRNFGQQAAITAGLAECSGNVAIVMDCDLQDPPELIPALYEKYCEGFDVVMAERRGKSHSLLRQVASVAYFRLMKLLTGTSFGAKYGSFSLISRNVIDGYLRLRDVNRHYLFIIEWLGFDVAAVPYDQEPRASGQSSYSLGRLLRHAAEGMLFQTTAFLNWIIYLGLAIALGGLAHVLVLFYRYFTVGALAGWTSLASLVVLFGGLQIVTIGLVGLYVGQVFDQTKARPIYIVDKRITSRKRSTRRINEPRNLRGQEEPADVVEPATTDGE